MTAAGADRATYIDLFAGVGGFSLGCSQAGLRQLAAYDIEKPMVDAYEENLTRVQKDVLVRKRDLSTATAVDILADTAGVRPTIVVGGPPCQAFSVLGRREPGDARGDLTLKYADLVIGLEPDAFAMENVPGILSLPIATQVRDRLRSAGYPNATWLKLEASDFGVPQRRRRVMLVGSTAGAPPTVGELLGNFKRKTTVAEALRSLPRARAKASLLDDPYVPYRSDARFASGSYAAEMRSDRGAVSGCQLTIHDKKTIKRYAKLTADEVDADTSCRRLDPNGFAPTLRAGTRSRTACRPVHPYLPRVITVREAARLHSFPDWYDFHEVVSLAHVQIGNSVPPRLARAVASWLAQFAVRQGDEDPRAAAAAS